MKVFYLFLVCFAFLFSGCGDSGVVCVYANKDVTVYNNTAFEIKVAIGDNFNAQLLGTMKAFEIQTFNVPYNVFIAGGTDSFYDQLYVDPCKSKYDLYVDDY